MLTDGAARRDFLRLALRGNDFYTGLRFDELRTGIDDADAPWFAMVNQTTVHAPYRAPKPYMRAETPELRRPRLALLEELLDSSVRIDRSDVRRDRLLAAADGAGSTSVAMRHYESGDYLNHAELAVLRAWYRACVRYLDDRLGGFLDWLEGTGASEDTLLVLASDHGEFFGEDRRLYHGNFLRDEVLRVPLIVAGPGVPAGERRTDLASLVDLFPTVADLAGVAAPEGDGRPLFGERREERDAVFAEEAVEDLSDEPAASAVSEATRREFELGRKSIRTDEYRFERRSDGTERLSRVPSGERAESPPEDVVAPLRERLRETLGESFEPGTRADEDFSAGVERNLRQLGYLE